MMPRLGEAVPFGDRDDAIVTGFELHDDGSWSVELTMPRDRVDGTCPGSPTHRAMLGVCITCGANWPTGREAVEG